MSVEAKLSKLSTKLKSTVPSESTKTLPKAGAPLDSWDDEDADVVVEAPGPSLRQIVSNDGPAPPPPTPVSPTSAQGVRSWSDQNGKPTPRQGSRYSAEIRRPEKTTAAASRMISGALGVRAPQKTEDQKQYDRAVKEAEIKRKNKEKEAREIERLADEKAKADVWDG